MKTMLHSGRIGRSYVPEGSILPPAGDEPFEIPAVAVRAALDALCWSLLHGRDRREAMKAARMAARLHGGLGWLGVAYDDATNRSCLGVYDCYRESRGEFGALRLALNTDVGLWRDEQGRERQHERLREESGKAARLMWRLLGLR